MTSTSIYWYDFETFGADPRRDRACQFAGIRTDEELNIIGDPLVLYCQPANDFLPNPFACLITGITPQKANMEETQSRNKKLKIKFEKQRYTINTIIEKQKFGESLSRS